ncbi:DeoR/GlpR family DNA-binding transcription regulator [Oceanithermus sp.]
MNRKRKRGAPLTEQRRRLILERLRSTGEVRTSELAGLFGVSPMTIRNDLNALSGAGVLKRTHGGAVSNEPISREPSYKDKETQHIAEKSRIGREAAGLLQSGMVVFIGNGTTTMQLIRQLPRLERLVVFTNALNHAGALLGREGVEVYVVGGYLRGVSYGMVGPLARRALEGVYFDAAFVGVNGVSLEQGYTLPSLEEAAVVGEVIGRSRAAVVLADHSKFGVVTHARVAVLGDVDTLITDRPPEPACREALAEAGVNLLVAEGGEKGEENGKA